MASDRIPVTLTEHGILIGIFVSGGSADLIDFTPQTLLDPDIEIAIVDWRPK